MSMYGDDERGCTKNQLYYDLNEAIDKLGIAEVLSIIADVMENKED